MGIQYKIDIPGKGVTLNYIDEFLVTKQSDGTQVTTEFGSILDHPNIKPALDGHESLILDESIVPWFAMPVTNY